MCVRACARLAQVVLSEKMRFAIVAVPLLWQTYAALLLLCTSLGVQDVVTLLMAAPDLVT